MAAPNIGCSVYYIFTPCCGGEPIKFCRQTPLTTGLVYVYTGPGVTGFGGSLVNGQCYTISTASVIGGGLICPPLTSTIAADLTSTSGCADVECDACFYKLTFVPCCGGQSIAFEYDPLYPNFPTNVYQYTGTDLEFGVGGVLIPNGCYKIVKELSNETEAATLPTPPSSTLFDFVGKACGNLNPGVECAPCNYYYQITNCADETETYCTTSNLSAYINNLIEDDTLWPIIQVTQYPDKCFYVEQIATCSSPVTITFSGQSFVGCAACQQDVVKYYQLVGCTDNTQIIYTSTDLSTLIGHVITLADYDDCYFVTAYDGLVPSDIVVTPKDTYDTCQECTLPRYILEDCLGVEDSIITQTDLSNYVGEVIVLKSCPDVCWTVSETEQTITPSEVFIDSGYTACEDCLADIKPCLCSTITNNQVDATTFRYIDCNGEEQSTASVEPGATSDKYCVIAWVSGIGVPAYYGDCTKTTGPVCYTYNITIPPLTEPQTLHYKDCYGIDQTQNFPIAKSPVQVNKCGIPNQTSQDIYITGSDPVVFVMLFPCDTTIIECPAEAPKPKRKVTPGYDTPACTPEYYENVECTFSEWMYKDVLEKRYGITNCCPEELMRWEIKHEMLMLDSLVNPDYICQEGTTCCPLPTSSCGCGSSCNCNC